MTRTQHYSHPTTAFPVYCLDWTADSTVLLGGGGGASRSGIANKLKLCSVSADGTKVDDVAEIALSSEEDAPMTIALDRASEQLVTGINQSSSSIQAGTNGQARVYSYTDNELSHVRSQQTIHAEWSDDYPYQKLTALSRGKKTAFVAVGTTDNKVAVLRFPSLEIALEPFAVEGGDLVDLDFGGPYGSWLAVTTASKVDVYDLEDGEKPHLELLHSISTPSIDGLSLSFRSARFAPAAQPPASASSCPGIYAVLNSAAPARRDRGKARKAFVVRFDATCEESGPSQDSEDEKPAKVKGVQWAVGAKREVASKPVTVFDISSDGKLVAFGCSDLSIGMLDASTLAPLLKILQAHSFPPTALKFNPSATMLVSASADNTIRTVVVPSSFGGASSSAVAIILAILIIIIAILLSK